VYSSDIWTLVILCSVNLEMLLSRTNAWFVKYELIPVSTYKYIILATRQYLLKKSTYSRARIRFFRSLVEKRQHMHDVRTQGRAGYLQDITCGRCTERN